MCCAHYSTYNDCKKRRYPNVIELVTIPGGRRLSGAESIDLSFCLDPAGLSLQYSNGHSPTHRWYRQNIPRNSAKHCIEAFVLHKGLLTVVDIFTLPQWYPQEVPAPLEENSGTYLSDPLHTTTRILRREIGKALWPESAQVSKKTLRRSTTTPKLSKTRFSPIVQIDFERPSHTLSIYVPLHYRWSTCLER